MGSNFAIGNGITGSNGKTIRSGSGTPSNALGVDGDFYIDLDVYEIYGPKVLGVWGSPTPLQGADGVNGTDGIDGQGVPVGGTTGQILSKIDNTDNNTQWIDPPASGIACIVVSNEFQQFGQNWYTWTNLAGGFNQQNANLNAGSTATPTLTSTQKRGGIPLPAGTTLKRITMILNSTSGAGKEVAVSIGTGGIPSGGGTVSSVGPETILLNDATAFTSISANNYQKYQASLGDYVVTEDNYLHVYVRGDSSAPASVLRNYTAMIIEVILP